MLSYASAGHQIGFVLLESGEMKRPLDSTGLPLGLFPDSTYTLEESIRLDAGEIALFLTDGVTESSTPNGEQFGTPRLLDYVRDHRQHSASQISKDIYQATRLFVQGDLQDDDITTVIVKASN
jgi:phosphoserine phosphatase RsbU/P